MFYVYAYLREDGSPYYIGKGIKYRAWSKDHAVKLPTDKKRIVIMESNLTEVGAFALERFYIQWYGRKDQNNGILRNLTDGGEGASLSEVTKNKIRDANKGKIPWIKGKNISESHKNKISKANLGHKRSVGDKNSRYGKGDLIKGDKNPNAKIWQLIDKSTHQKILISDLVQYCSINNLNYQTVYCWQKQNIDNEPRLKRL